MGVGCFGLGLPCFQGGESMRDRQVKVGMALRAGVLRCIGCADDIA